MERWAGRVALVTGASAGIGNAITRALVEKGMRVVAVARRLDRLQTLTTELQHCKGEIHVLQCDVTDEADVIRVVKWTRENLGGTDVLVNNAGIYYREKLTSIDTGRMQKLFNVNVIGLCLFTREVIQDMRERGVDDGHIIHLNSDSGQSISSHTEGLLYGSTKHAVTVLTEGLRRELRDLKTKIRVTSISPGLVRTEIIEAIGYTKAQSDEYYNSTPHMQASDIADALVYVLSTPPHVQVHELTLLPL